MQADPCRRLPSRCNLSVRHKSSKRENSRPILVLHVDYFFPPQVGHVLPLTLPVSRHVSQLYISSLRKTGSAGFDSGARQSRIVRVGS